MLRLDKSEIGGGSGTSSARMLDSISMRRTERNYFTLKFS
jgi:hypothetical protein